jgi:MraZ protein
MEPVIKGSYTSTFEHTFDAKGRVTVPSAWRQNNHEKSLHVFPSSQPGCVVVYPESWMGERFAQMSGLKRSDPQRKQFEVLAAIAQPADFDEAGRIVVKEKLRQGAGIKKNVVLVGCGDHFEIWDEAARAKQPPLATTFEDAAAALGL